MGSGMNVPYTALQVVFKYFDHSQLDSVFTLTFLKGKTIFPRKMMSFARRLLTSRAEKC